ncbi:MAG: four helix bundle protein [Candidatus Doudnabacteria bacterium]
MHTKEKVNSFTDLKVWQVSHQIVLEIYTETKKFPREELFGLVNQLKRAAVSITSNIAEGFCRSTAKDKIHFYTISLGSLSEVQNQLMIARDLNFIEFDKFSAIFEQLFEVRRMIYGLMKSAENRF